MSGTPLHQGQVICGKYRKIFGITQIVLQVITSLQTDGDIWIKKTFEIILNKGSQSLDKGLVSIQ